MTTTMRAILLAGVLGSCAVWAPENATSQSANAAGAAPSLREWIVRTEADRGSLERFYSVRSSPARATRLRAFAREKLDELAALDFDALDRDGRIDWILARTELESEIVRLDRHERRMAEIEPLVPIGARIVALLEARARVEPLDPEAAAGELDALARELERLGDELEGSGAEPAVAKSVANRAARTVESLARDLGEWREFRAGYDPVFDWWVRKPHESLQAELERYGKLLRKELVGLEEGDEETIIGDPIGREALLEDLRAALIAYTPEELVAIGEREHAWCEAEMAAAARELGFDDWKLALEKVKEDHVAPGEQPALIQRLALEATAYVEDNGLVSVPPLARETWRMEMLSPEAQRTSPFFLGGEVIQVSFPTDAMTHEEKRMSMRGNNVHFARATVHHEVIPGHHLQGFMNDRFFAYRGPFATPFWTEGWALWWELHLWDRGFATTPEDRIGMLFWRMHRCARIRFSLGFHLGDLTPEQCIDLLVERVGHERENAEAEVRRSFNGDYGPLYQIAYMTGALQFRALYRELVESGEMRERDFHDAVLQSGNMPIEMVRARLTDLPLTRDFEPRWRFYELEK